MERLVQQIKWLKRKLDLYNSDNYDEIVLTPGEVRFIIKKLERLLELSSEHEV